MPDFIKRPLLHMLYIVTVAVVAAVVALIVAAVGGGVVGRCWYIVVLLRLAVTVSR